MKKQEYIKKRTDAGMEQTKEEGVERVFANMEFMEAQDEASR